MDVLVVGIPHLTSAPPHFPCSRSLLLTSLSWVNEISSHKKHKKLMPAVARHYVAVLAKLPLMFTLFTTPSPKSFLVPAPIYTAPNMAKCFMELLKLHKTPCRLPNSTSNEMRFCQIKRKKIQPWKILIFLLAIFTGIKFTKMSWWVGKNWWRTFPLQP